MAGTETYDKVKSNKVTHAAYLCTILGLLIFGVVASERITKEKGDLQYSFNQKVEEVKELTEAVPTVAVKRATIIRAVQDYCK